MFCVAPPGATARHTSALSIKSFSFVTIVLGSHSARISLAIRKQYTLALS